MYQNKMLSPLNCNDGCNLEYLNTSLEQQVYTRRSRNTTSKHYTRSVPVSALCSPSRKSKKYQLEHRKVLREIQRKNLLRSAERAKKLRITNWYDLQRYEIDMKKFNQKILTTTLQKRHYYQSIWHVLKFLPYLLEALMFRSSKILYV